MDLICAEDSMIITSDAFISNKIEGHNVIYIGVHETLNTGLPSINTYCQMRYNNKIKYNFTYFL